MRALVRTAYGPPEVLSVREVAKPEPKDGEVLVRVHAASVNSWDWDALRGEPRPIGRLGKRNDILGADVAGRVEATGAGVTKFRVGDAVFGDLSGGGWGGFAEYACAHEDEVVLKSAGLSFAQAAATPQAGLLALQGLRGRIAPGQKVLINGAGGGAGTFAIQLAKLAGAEVTGVDSAEKFEVMRAVGADHVIDYRRTDFTRSGKRYDLIYDVVAEGSLPRFWRALNRGGRLVVIGGRIGTIAQAGLLGPLIGGLQGRKFGLLLHRTSTADLEEMKALFATGTVRPVIDRVFSLTEGAEAIRYLGEGKAKGKVIVDMGV